MMKKLQKQLFENERSFYATLVCVCTLSINLFYYVFYNASPLTMLAVLPIIFWIAYDGNEHETATDEGYWIWVVLLIITSLLIVIYPLF